MPLALTMIKLLITPNLYHQFVSLSLPTDPFIQSLINIHNWDFLQEYSTHYVPNSFYPLAFVLYYLD